MGTRVRGEVGCLEDDYQLTAVAYANDGNVVYGWDRQLHYGLGCETDA